jgi:hypothetical protein
LRTLDIDQPYSKGISERPQRLVNMEYMASSSAPLWFKQAEVSLKKALNDLVTRDWNSAHSGRSKHLLEPVWI